MLLGLNMNFNTKVESFLGDLLTFITQSLRAQADVSTIELIVDSGEYVHSCFMEMREARSHDYYVLRLKLCRNEMVNINYFLNILNVEKNEDLQIRKIKLLNEIKALIRLMNVKMVSSV